MDQAPQNNGAQPQQPVQPQKQVPQPETPASIPPSPPVQPTQPMNPVPKKSPKGRLIIGAVVAAVLVGGGVVAAMGFMNSPAKVWERAVGNTQKGIERFIELSEEPSDGMKIDGALSVSAPLAVDGSVSGHFYKGSGVMTMDIGAAGFRVDGEVRSVSVENSDNPDVYVKLDGLEAVASLLGLATGGLSAPDDEVDSLSGTLSEINNQWYVIDHTLLDQALASATGEGGAPELTDEDVDQISMKIMQVASDYLFTTDADSVVVEVLEEYGKEDFEGTSTQKYKAGLNKENLKKMITALRDTLADTKLAELITDGTDQSYEEITNLDQMFKELDRQDFSRATADIWVEASGKYVRNIRIYPVEDSKDSSYLDFAIPFEGGDTVPLVVRATIDQDDTKGVVSLGIDVNSQTADTRFWSDVDVDLGLGQQFVLQSELNITRTDESIDVQKPEGAKNIYELLPVLSGALDPALTGPSDPYGSVPFGEPAPLGGPDYYPIDDIEL